MAPEKFDVLLKLFMLRALTGGMCNTITSNVCCHSAQPGEGLALLHEEDIYSVVSNQEYLIMIIPSSFVTMIVFTTPELLPEDADLLRNYIATGLSRGSVKHSHRP